MIDYPRPYEDARKDLHKSIRAQDIWGKIHRAAKTDEVLDEMLAEVYIYWCMKYKDSK